MSSGSTRQPDAPDPQMLIQAQTQANRVNQIGPYGSSTYSTGPDGQATQTSELSPEMQAVADRVFAQAGERPEQAQQWQLPGGYNDLMSAVGGRVGERYGLGAKPQSSQPMPAPDPYAQQAGMSGSGGAFGAMGSAMGAQQGQRGSASAQAAALARAMSRG
jgi:hypothetical protein